MTGILGNGPHVKLTVVIYDPTESRVLLPEGRDSDEDVRGE